MTGIKILVIGTSSSGKTTLGKNVADALDYPCFDLDEFHWLPDWEEKEDDLFIADIRKTILREESWVVSGNYITQMKSVLWPKVDTIIWLDYPLTLILLRFFRRTFKRVVLKEPCCNGNIETFDNVFFGNDNMLGWILRTHQKRKKQFNDFKQGEFADKDWIILKSLREEKRFLNRLTV